MTVFLFFMLTFLALAIIGYGLRKRERTIQFPFLFAVVFLGWLLPQLVGLINIPYLPRGGLDKTLFMAILCLSAAWCGYSLNRQPAKLFWWRFKRQRLLLGSLFFSLVGGLLYYQVDSLSSGATAEFGGQWSGIITIYIFFSKLLSVGMVIALLLHLNNPSWVTFSIILFDLLFYLDHIIIKGRRAAMVELVMMLIMAIWFRYRWAPPRWAMITGIILGILVVNSIGDYRQTMLKNETHTWSGAGISKVLEIDFLGNIQRLINGETNYSLVIAVMNIEATDRQMKFDYGLSHWNRLVQRYVPKQLVGNDLKDALMLDFINVKPVSKQAYSEFGYESMIGSTPTGLSDAFQSFWYFGFINFLLIGLIMSRWYKAAIRGNFSAQIIVILSITTSLHSITHSTHWFFIYFIQLAVFLIPLLMLARVNNCDALKSSFSESTYKHNYIAR